MFLVYGDKKSHLRLKFSLEKILLVLKDLNSTVAKRGSVFIGLMTPDGAI